MVPNWLSTLPFECGGGGPVRTNDFLKGTCKHTSLVFELIPFQDTLSTPCLKWKHALFSKIGFLTIHKFQFFGCIILVRNPTPDLGAAAGFVASMFPLQMAWLAWFEAKKKAEAKLEKLKAKQEKSGKSKEGSKRGQSMWKTGAFRNLDGLSNFSNDGSEILHHLG